MTCSRRGERRTSLQASGYGLSYSSPVMKVSFRERSMADAMLTNLKSANKPASTSRPRATGTTVEAPAAVTAATFYPADSNTIVAVTSFGLNAWCRGVDSRIASTGHGPGVDREQALMTRSPTDGRPPGSLTAASSGANTAPIGHDRGRFRLLEPQDGLRPALWTRTPVGRLWWCGQVQPTSLPVWRCRCHGIDHDLAIVWVREVAAPPGRGLLEWAHRRGWQHRPGRAREEERRTAVRRLGLRPGQEGVKPGTVRMCGKSNEDALPRSSSSSPDTMTT